MSTGTQTAKAQITVASEIRIRDEVLAVAGNEYEFQLVDNLKQLKIKARDRFAVIDYYFMQGDSNTVQIPNSCEEHLTGLSFTGKKLYLKSDVANVTVEIVEFY